MRNITFKGTTYKLSEIRNPNHEYSGNGIYPLFLGDITRNGEKIFIGKDENGEFVVFDVNGCKLPNKVNNKNGKLDFEYNGVEISIDIK
ncbi:MAG: hypothetical protein PHE25_03345 [Candidatus Gracilibacteria bacterium]|nr:hypothetical protein [Candidatus Gracilibacteria bacterium]